MKKLLLLLIFLFSLFIFSEAQEYADFEFTATHQGTGTFVNAALPNFTWIATGSINEEVQILDDEVFDDGNEFENIFGQADNAENLRTQVVPNGVGTIGQAVISKATLTINFNQITPAEDWGFCVVDIDVENCLISAIDENDNEVSVEDINDWLIEFFDTDLVEDGLNTPKWDPAHAALLGFNTPESYIVYNNLVIGGMDESEAAAAFFMPDIPLKSLIIDFENLQDQSFVSFHFYIASLNSSGIDDEDAIQLRIYPNPASSVVSIQSARKVLGGSQQSVIVEILDLNGRMLIEKSITWGAGNADIDVSWLESGVYFCRILTDEGSATQKLIIQ